MGKLSLPEIKDLIDDGGYGGRGVLSTASSALGLSAALFLADLNLWSGAGYYLTDNEIDEIQEMVADLENELMEAGELVPNNAVSLQMSTDVDVDNDEEYKVEWDTEVFDYGNMHSILANTWRVNILEDGLYQVNYQLGFDATGTNYRYSAIVYHDTSEIEDITVAPQLTYPSSTNQAITLSASVLLELEETDYLYLTVWQGESPDLPLVAANGRTALQCFRIPGS